MLALISASPPWSSLRPRRPKRGCCSSPLHSRCAGPHKQLSALARREYGVFCACMHATHSFTACLTTSAGAGPLSVPVHARTPVPPVAHLTMAPLTSGPDRRLPGMYTTIVGSSSTFSLRASQRYQPRAVHRSSWPPGFESRVPNHVRPPLLTTTLCPDHGTSERSCTRPACAACGPSTSASHPHRPSPDDAASAP